MAQETFVGQKLITEDGLNGLPVRVFNGAGAALATAANVTIQTSQTLTVTGAAAGTLACGQYVEMAVCFNVTAVSGTGPSDQAAIQFSPDGGTTWVTVQSATLTTTGQFYLPIGTGPGKPFGSLIRIFHTITGTTPSFTMSVTAGAK